MVIVMQILVTPIILRFGGKEVLGVYSFLMQVITWASSRTWGSTSPSTETSRRPMASRTVMPRARKIFITGRTYYFFYNVLFGVIIFILSFYIGHLIKMAPDQERAARLSLLILSGYVILRVPVIMFGSALATCRADEPRRT